MNYKIRITAENQAIVKRIADENGMNPKQYKFMDKNNFYLISDNKFFHFVSKSDYIELSTEQFIELFDKKETELEKWLKETKAKNLSLEKLKIYITNKSSCNDDLYKKLRIKLDIKYGISLAEFLFNQWNNPTKESPKVETESRKIIGYKAPFDFVWGGVKKGDIAIRDEFQPYVYNVGISARIAMEIVETWEPIFEPLPIEQPKETDFKSKFEAVIELIEKNINDKQEKLKFVTEKIKNHKENGI